MHCYDRARQLIREHRPLMDRLAEALLEQETIEGQDFRKIVAEYTQLPSKQRKLMLAKL